MYLPAELAEEDIALRLSLFTQRSFGLSLTYADSSPGSIEIPSIYLNGETISQERLAATPTVDGYLVVRAPIGKGAYNLALQLGDVFEWVEIKSATASPVSSLKATGSEPALTRGVAVHSDGIEERAKGIFECTNDQSVLLFQPPEIGGVTENEEDWMLEVVLRPLVFRTAPTAETLAPQHTDQVSQAAA